MSINALIFNSVGRLRSGWRVAIFLAVWILLSGFFGTVIFAGLRSGLNETPGRFLELAIGSAISLAAALLVGAMAARWLEALPFRSLGASPTGRWLWHLVGGLAVGGCSVSIAIAFAATFGDYDLRLNPEGSWASFFRSAGVSFLVLAIAAAFEEALFRGYIFQTFTRAGLSWLAILLTAVFFGAVHIGNPNAGTISTIDTVFAGVLFGIAYLKTRDLWFPFGIHLMWNWMQGSIFGVEVSGITELSAGSLLIEIDNGPEWLTGGRYGIEGGIASTIALVLTGISIYLAPLRADPHLVELTDHENPRESVS